MFVRRSYLYLDNELKRQIYINNKVFKNKKNKTLSINKKYYIDEIDTYIKEYNNETDFILKNEIYNKKIRKYILRLIINVLNVNKNNSTYIREYFEDLICDIESFIFSNVINKIDIEKGKSYSYLTVSIINYIIERNKFYYKKYSKYIFIDTDIENTFEYDTKFYKFINNNINDTINIEEIMINFSKYINNNITKFFKKEKDIKIVKAILFLIDSYKSIDNITKANVYRILRNTSGYNAEQITRVINKLKIKYNIFKNKFIILGG